MSDPTPIRPPEPEPDGGAELCTLLTIGGLWYWAIFGLSLKAALALAITIIAIYLIVTDTI